jgi:hypothetical protein
VANVRIAFASANAANRWKVNMSSDPFVVSTEVITWFAEKLHNEVGDSSLKPILSFVCSLQGFDEHGHLDHQIRKPFLLLSWDTLAAIESFGFIAINIAGFEVFASRDTLKRMTGKKLVIETVDTGVQNRRHAKWQLLRAVPFHKDEPDCLAD